MLAKRTVETSLNRLLLHFIQQELDRKSIHLVSDICTRACPHVWSYDCDAEACCHLMSEKLTLPLAYVLLKLPNIKPETVKRLDGHGLPFPKSPNQYGNMPVKFQIVFRYGEQLSSCYS